MKWIANGLLQPEQAAESFKDIQRHSAFNAFNAFNEFVLKTHSYPIPQLLVELSCTPHDCWYLLVVPMSRLLNPHVLILQGQVCFFNLHQLKW